MDKEEKKEHLENIKIKINRMTPNQMNINELSYLIKSELSNEENLDKPNRIYIFNLKQTIEKQLNNLINSRKKPNNRIDEFNETRNNFQQDINRYLGDLRKNY